MADTSSPPAAPKLALDFKSANLYAVRVVLHSADTDALVAALAQRMADAGSFFQNEPVVLDASRLDAEIDWPRLLDALREHDLPAIGVVAEGANLAAARAAGLTSVELAAPPTRPQATAAADNAPAPALATEAAEVVATPAPAQAVPAETPAPVPAVVPQASPAAMVVTRPLRSGQRVYARHTDLIVVGMVSQGAEVIADGNIHIYAPLRGRALAGARGDANARIFTTCFEAELTSVAGVYRTFEPGSEKSLTGKPVQIRLEGEKLVLEALKTS